MARTKAFDETRALDAAVDCFWMHGFEATSIRDLTEAMGINGPSLYNAFGDKQALFRRSLERYADRSMRERVARLEAEHQACEAIRAFFAEIVERSLKDRDHKGCMLVNSALDVAPHDAAVGRVVRGYLDEIRAFFERNLEAARRLRRLPADVEPVAYSRHLLGVLLGIRVLARTGAGRALLEDIARPALAPLEPRQ